MPRSDRANTAIKQRARDYADSAGVAYTEALEIVSDPLNEILCHTCGWTVGMVCPECPGCGCYNSRCSGWRHREDERNDDPEDHRVGCEECGGSYDDRFGSNGYDCTC